MGFLSVKVVLISSGIVSMAMGLKLTVPVISNFLLTEAPFIWSFILTCLTPPYLYILLNFIILTIFASSKLHDSTHNSPQDTTAATTTLLPTEPLIYSAAAYDGAPVAPPLPPHQIPAPEPVKISGDAQIVFNDVVSDGYIYQEKTLLKDVEVISGNIHDENSPAKTTVTSSDEARLPRKESSEFAFSDENGRPPVSARFSHRKAVRASPEGAKVVALGVAKPKKQDTLENTWRTITEGRPMPLTRHLKKSDTWEPHARRNAAPLSDLNGAAATIPAMKKSETFNGRENGTSPGSGCGRLRKEPSLSQDELNRRVEAFINKFNEEMRLQRQESLRQHREMMGRGAR